MAKKTITSKAFRFTPEELEILESAAAKHGNYKAGLMAALRRELGANDLTQDQVIDWIRRNAG